MPADLTPLEEDLLAALGPAAGAEGAAAYRDILGTAPPAGDDEAGDDRASDYIRGKLRAWGVPFATERCEAVVGLPGEARLSLARRDAPVPALAHPYSAATPEGGLVAELRPATPDGGDRLDGAIALVEGEPDGAAVARLAARGAIAQVYIGPDEALRPVAVPDAWGGTTATPVVGIGRAAGEGFLALCSAGPTAVRLAARPAWDVRRAPITVATIAGADEPRDYLLVGAALPAGPGATGEAAACLLELCRVVAAEAGRLRRGLRCAWWPGGLAPAAGPLWYADAHWADLAAHCWGYVALRDAARAPGTAGWAEAHLRHFAEAALRDADAGRPRWSPAPPLADLAPVARLGLPTLALAAGAPADGYRVPAGGTHRSGSGVAGVGRDALPTLLTVVARLCAMPLPPLDLPALARAVQERIGATLDAVGDRLDLAPLRARAAALVAAAEKAQIALLHLAQADSPNDEEGLALANGLVRRLQRLLLPALRHPGDPHALPPPDLVAAPLPGLAAALAYAALPPGDDPAALNLRAAALRERNRLLDALDAALAATDDALAALRPLGFG